MNIIKKILFIAVFVILAVFLPLTLTVFFSEEMDVWNNFLVVFAVVMFTILGYIVVSIRQMSKDLKDAVEAVKMQNAAIAYKLTEDVFDSDKDSKKKNPKAKKREDDAIDEEAVDTSSVNLNPEEPLVPSKSKNKKAAKKINDNYDDFK